MDDATAVAVINEAKARHIIQTELPAEADERLKLAEELVAKATTARDRARGSAKEAVEAVLGAAGTNGDVESPPPKEDGDSGISEPSGPAEGHERDMLRLPSGEELPIPPEVRGEVPPVPIDLTNEDDRAIRRLYSAANACSQRAKYIVAVTEGELSHEKRMLDEEIASQRRVVKTRTDEGEKRLAADIEAEIMSTANVKHALTRVEESQDMLRKLKALRDGYDADCERISREFTMRETSWQHEGGLPHRGVRSTG